MNTNYLLNAVATVAFALTASVSSAQSNAQGNAAPAAAANQAAVAGAVVAGSKTDSKPGLTRAEVIAQYLEARKNGEIPETEADFDVAQTKKHYAK